MLKLMCLRLRSSAYREPSFGHGCISLPISRSAERSRARCLLEFDFAAHGARSCCFLCTRAGMPSYWLHSLGSARVCWVCTESRVCPAVSWRSSTPLRLSGPGTQPPFNLGGVWNTDLIYDQKNHSECSLVSRTLIEVLRAFHMW